MYSQSLENLIDESSPTVMHRALEAAVHGGPATRRSTVDLVVDELSAAIYAGRLVPGMQLREMEFTAALGVSRSCFREALQRLISDGVVEHAPGRGAWVRLMTPEDVVEVYTVREALELQALRTLVRTDADLGALWSGLAELESAAGQAPEVGTGAGTDVQSGTGAEVDAETVRLLGNADLAFHIALVDAVGSASLSRMIRAEAIRTRLLSLSLGSKYVVRCDVPGTHRAVVEHLALGDLAAAGEVLGRIMRESIDRLCGDLAEEDYEVVTGGPLGVDEAAASARSAVSRVE